MILHIFFLEKKFLLYMKHFIEKNSRQLFHSFLKYFLRALNSIISPRNKKRIRVNF